MVSCRKRGWMWVLLMLVGSTCHAQDITVRYDGMTAKVTQKTKDSVKVVV